jgi:D-psicose/D-tagatose/L-ribulose 3-epimerase
VSVNRIGVISMFYARPFGREHFSVFARVKKAGLDFVEMLVPEPGELDLVETRAALADHGLGVILAARVNLARDLASADRSACENGVRYLETCVEAAAKVGATIVGGPLFGSPLVFAGRAPAPVSDDERRRRIDQIVEGFRRAGRRAHNAGVVFGVEPLNRFETDIANTAEQALALVRQTDSPAVGIMLDTFHMNMEEYDMGQAIRRAGPHLVHFQANENNRTFVGKGHINWTMIARALHDANYSGPIALEPFRRDDQQEPGTPLAQWRAPTRNEDEDLAASAIHLRRALEAAGRQ